LKMDVKRRAVEKNYAEQIEAMYAGKKKPA